MRTIAKLFFALLVIAGSAHAASFVPGKDYMVLNPPQPMAEGVIEVYEFFSYLCPHCFSFRPRMHEWQESAPDGVGVTRVPVIFNDSWRPAAQAYVVAEVLGVVDKVHAPLFNAIHVEKRRLRSKDDYIEVFVAQGVPEEQVEKAWDSFAVDHKLRQTMQLVRAYRIDRTPSVSVAGKYVINPNTAGTHERMIDMLDTLVKQELNK